MGKFAVRLSSRKKAKRWRKGQSASSNPDTKKYREKAQSSFFQPNLGSTTLTTEILRRHDAIQSSPMEQDAIKNTETPSEGSESIKTFETFASDYSNCSNVSFERFLNHFQSNSAIHKEMLAVLAAVTEVIKQNNGTESSTEYYAALMTTLESTDSPESTTAILSLLGMGMKTVPKNVLKLQFGQASAVFLQILSKYATEENFLILRHCIGCLSILLRCQELATWSNSSTIQVLDAILVFSNHSKPKVRKAAQNCICSILKGSDFMKSDDPPAYHPGALTVAKYCLSQLQMTAQPGQVTSTLHTLSMLKDIFQQIPKSHVKDLCEAILSNMTLNNILITSCCFQTLHSLFISRPTEAILPSQLNAQIINALYDYQPAPGDEQPTLAWLTVMQEACSNLALNSKELCMANMAKITGKCIELWLSDKSTVLTGASHTLKAILETCIEPVCQDEQLAKQYETTLIKIMHLLQEGMKYQYHSAWHHVLHLLAIILKIIGPHCPEDATKILVALTELRESFKFSYNSEIEYAVGAAVKAMGADFVLKAIPLNNKGGIDIKRSWLLPVLKDSINKGSILFFGSYLLPLAKNCENKAKVLKEKNEGIASHSNELLVSQIWSLLPNCCNNAPDIKDNFKRIAETLGTVIRDRKDLRLFAMAALRKIIKTSIEEDKIEEKNEISKFAKNYLPILFNLYTTKPHGSDEEGQRLAAFETIKVYLAVTNKDLIGELFDTALNKMSETTDNDFLKDSLNDLVRLLIQYSNADRIQILYTRIETNLTNTKNHKDQKKAYRCLEDICNSESDLCKKFISENRRNIQKAIVKSVTKVQKPSKGARIRCISHLVKIHPSLEKTKFLKAIVPEAIMCIKELNEKCRQSSYNLLNIIADKFIKKEEYFMEYIDLIMAGLEAEPTYCSATLLALAAIVYNYNGTIGMQKIQDIFMKSLSLIVNPTREIVLSALSFLKVYLTIIPTPIIAPNLPDIIKSLTTMVEDCKRHFRQKVRDLIMKLGRKFGIDNIISLVPSSDQIMHKRLKNIKKIENRKQKIKEQKKQNSVQDESAEEEFNVKRKPKSLEEILADSDNEDYDDLEDEKSVKSQKRNIKKAWIKESEENITDFIDSKVAAKNISATLPSTTMKNNSETKKKDRGFKVAPDGRLIITENDDSDSDDDKKHKKKKKKKSSIIPEMPDSDKDDEMDDNKSVKSVKSVKTVATNLNRKRKGTGSVSDSKFKYEAGGSGIHRPIKKHKEEQNGRGAEYKSKKAAGDIKLKNKPDPYAYIPLKRSSLNRRNKKRNKEDFDQYFTKSKKGKRSMNGKRK